jgi:hypothetical protein
MRRMILGMIATGSLSAFSTSALPALPSVQGSGNPNPLRRARATDAQPQPQARPTPPATAEQGKQTQQSGRPQPRGSLIDLSV